MSKKITYVATAPDGTEITRTSARVYTHAVLVQYRRRERDVIEGTPRWGVLSFNGREELARKESDRWQPFIAERRWTNQGGGVEEKFLSTLVVPVKVR